MLKPPALAAGVRGDLTEGQREEKFAGHSWRAGLASPAEFDERHVQKQLGHASTEMTSGYQRRRDRFRVNLTKAARLWAERPLPRRLERRGTRCVVRERVPTTKHPHSVACSRHDATRYPPDQSARYGHM